MKASFDVDAYPGRPKILFIGFAESSHTHSWIDLLSETQLNVRLFSISSGGGPPDNWNVRTYVTSYYTPPVMDPRTRARLFARDKVSRSVQRISARIRFGDYRELADRWLARIIRRWRPDIIHTLGLDPAGEIYLRVRDRFGLDGLGKWVLQLRGGSDLTLSRLDPQRAPQLAKALRACDQLISDNRLNFAYARELGVREEQMAALSPVPGTGGIDVASLAQNWQGNPSGRRLILWPKVYECPWGKVLPVFEALKLCWERIRPCRIQMLAVSAEARMWYWTLPEEIRESCLTDSRLPRDEVLELMTQARVMLAPSLVDGVPNSMYEAMAAGAFPIVSPLETITPLVTQEQNVLFARNLYPEEIAAALTRAMSDDVLVDGAAARNLALVEEIADRANIRERVINYYGELAGQ